METSRPSAKFNYRRRAAGIAICVAPISLVVVAGGASLFWPRQSGLGLGLSVAGLLVAGFNLYLSLRPMIYRRRVGSMDGFRNVSGLPCIGTALAVLGGAIGFGDWRAAAIALLALAMDTCGLPWFLIATWRDRSFWDA